MQLLVAKIYKSAWLLFEELCAIISAKKDTFGYYQTGRGRRGRRPLQEISKLPYEKQPLADFFFFVGFEVNTLAKILELRYNIIEKR